MKPVIFHPEARDETDEAAKYYAAVSDELRSDFLDEIERLATIAVASKPFCPIRRFALGRTELVPSGPHSR